MGAEEAETSLQSLEFRQVFASDGIRLRPSNEKIYSGHLMDVSNAFGLVACATEKELLVFRSKDLLGSQPKPPSPLYELKVEGVQSLAFSVDSLYFLAGKKIYSVAVERLNSSLQVGDLTPVASIQTDQTTLFVGSQSEPLLLAITVADRFYLIHGSVVLTELEGITTGCFLGGRDFAAADTKCNLLVFKNAAAHRTIPLAPAVDRVNAISQVSAFELALFVTTAQQRDRFQSINYESGAIRGLEDSSIPAVSTNSSMVSLFTGESPWIGDRERIDAISLWYGANNCDVIAIAKLENRNIAIGRLPEEGKIVLPLSASEEETWPIAVAVDFSSNQPFQWNSEAPPISVPVLWILTSDLALLAYRVVKTDTILQFSKVCMKPKTLPNEETAAKGFGFICPPSAIEPAKAKPIEVFAQPAGANPSIQPTFGGTGSGNQLPPKSPSVESIFASIEERELPQVYENSLLVLQPELLRRLESVRELTNYFLLLPKSLRLKNQRSSPIVAGLRSTLCEATNLVNGISLSLREAKRNADACCAVLEKSASRNSFGYQDEGFEESAAEAEDADFSGEGLSKIMKKLQLSSGNSNVVDELLSKLALSSAPHRGEIGDQGLKTNFQAFQAEALQAQGSLTIPIQASKAKQPIKTHDQKPAAFFQMATPQQSGTLFVAAATDFSKQPSLPQAVSIEPPKAQVPSSLPKSEQQEPLHAALSSKSPKPLSIFQELVLELPKAQPPFQAPTIDDSQTAQGVGSSRPSLPEGEPCDQMAITDDLPRQPETPQTASASQLVPGNQPAPPPFSIDWEQNTAPVFGSASQIPQLFSSISAPNPTSMFVTNTSRASPFSFGMDPSQNPIASQQPTQPPPTPEQSKPSFSQFRF